MVEMDSGSGIQPLRYTPILAELTFVDHYFRMLRELDGGLLH